MREPPVTRAERSALLAQAEGDPDGYDVERPLEQPLDRPILTTVCYCAVMGINGGLCGAFGPSLEMFERSTGLSQAALGASVMQNRLAKLGGTVFWGIYASSTSKRAATGEDPPLGVQPHTLMAIGLLLTALSTSVLGHTKSGFQLQAAMVLSGFMYGVTDSAANLLIMWCWQHDDLSQRVYVAVLNAMFTVGAFVTPMLVALAIHYVGSVIWPAYYVLSTVAILVAVILPMLPAPAPPRRRPAGSIDGVELHERFGDRGANPSPRRATSAPSSLDRLAADEAGAEVPRTHASPAPGTSSKLARHAARSPSGGATRWFYVGDAGAEHISRDLVVMGAICTVCFFANGCEHTMATWLSSFGIKQRRLGEETMAIMTSNFWTAMALGRVGWACFSGFVSSAWPSLFANTLCCILSAGCLFMPERTAIWSAAMGIGLGVASTWPAAVTLPSEMKVVMSPRMMTTLQLSASFGEMLCPFVMGLAFQLRRYSLFAGLVLGWQLLVLAVLCAAYMLLMRRAALPERLVRAARRVLPAPEVVVDDDDDDDDAELAPRPP